MVASRLKTERSTYGRPPRIQSQITTVVLSLSFTSSLQALVKLELNPLRVIAIFMTRL